MNTTIRCAHTRTRYRRPRSIQKLTADLQGIGDDLALIVHGIETQRGAQPNPLLTVPRFDGEDIHRLANAMAPVITSASSWNRWPKSWAR